MSAITIDNNLVHYEVLGRGRPVILLHGWLGSWRYWIPTMQQLGMKYRVYALDLWGFGDTEKDPQRYSFASQVKLLMDFMEKLGIGKAAIVGHALGAGVAITFTRQFPERAPRVMLISPPLYDMGGIGAPIPAPASLPAPTPIPSLPFMKPATPAQTPALPTPAGSTPATPAAPAIATPATVAAKPATPANSSPTPNQPAAPAPATTTPAPSTAPSAAPSTAPSAPAAAIPALKPATPAPASVAAATSTPATVSVSAPAPVAAPAATATPVGASPAAATPSIPSPAPVAPAVPTSTMPAPTPPAPVAPVTPVTPAIPSPAPVQNPGDTLPRNPFANNPELLNNSSTATLPKAPTQPTAPGTVAPARPSVPVPRPAGADPLSVPMPRPEVNPLVNLLSTINPKAALERHLARDPENLEKMRAEVEKMDNGILQRLAPTFQGINLAQQLSQLTSPVLLFHGREDAFFEPNEELINRIAALKGDGMFLPFITPEFRHFPMLEQTTKFNRLMTDFLDAPDLTNVGMKETWRRQLR